jgi:hypothetical protein
MQNYGLGTSMEEVKWETEVQIGGYLLSVYGLFNDAVSISLYTTSNDRMIIK